MNPEWIVAICAGITLLILWTTTVIGAAIKILNRIDAVKNEILVDFNLKHEVNRQTVQALEALVMRHDILLNPEFNGTGKQVARHQ